ncbi:phospholipase D family protein [Candidatus Micrarchaeota archaeon]|nr:phospholipase D family protein [Candidatus Micrarchaeota archaeon]
MKNSRDVTVVTLILSSESKIKRENMNKGVVFGSGLVLGIIICYFAYPLVGHSAVTPVFSPDDGQQVINFINSAQTSLDVEVYVFTSHDAALAIEKAKSRGVKVRVILEPDVDGSNDKIFGELLSSGIEVRWASKFYRLTHAKFIVVDGQAVLVGSHNLSNAALRQNREASVIVYDSSVVSQFEKTFQTDWTLAS